MIGHGSEAFTETTKKVDVYSFAIVAYEILTGNLCWGGKARSEIVDLVKAGERPVFPSYIVDSNESDFKNILPPIMNTIIQCWNQDPSSRPEFGEVAENIQALKSCLIE